MNLEFVESLPEDPTKAWKLISDKFLILISYYRESQTHEFSSKVVGENAKPMVDRVQEIANIIWRIQARAHGLPENSPSLPHGSSLELPEANED